MKKFFSDVSPWLFEGHRELTFFGAGVGLFTGSVATFITMTGPVKRSENVQTQTLEDGSKKITRSWSVSFTVLHALCAPTAIVAAAAYASPLFIPYIVIQSFFDRDNSKDESENGNKHQ
jgi:hypothetical protein